MWVAGRHAVGLLGECATRSLSEDESMHLWSRSQHFLQSRRFRWHLRDILRTPPLSPTGGSPVITSMLCHRDLLPYLLAVKSFYRRLGRGRIVIIDDGTLTRDDRTLLDAHVRPSEYVEARRLDASGCPGYISWKKLLCMARYVGEEFVIQLDSDTVTHGTDLSEVKACIDSGTSFILGTWAGQRIGTMAEAVEAARQNPSQHVQMVAERHFDRLEAYPELNYVRGCSGFDGFAPGSFDVGRLRSFSSEMFRLIGDKWNEWGSEQTMSNVIVANSPRAMVLPYPKYYNYWGTLEPAHFTHFVGSYRYHGGVYARQAQATIKELLDAGP